MAKRTYSQRDKRRPGYGYLNFPPDHDARHKRPKVDSSNKLRLPPSPPPSRGEKSSSLLKKSLKVFNGPISIPEAEIKVESAPKSKSRLTVLDKVLNHGFHAAVPKQHSIYGSREDFEETIKDEKKRKQNDSQSRTSQLPTPPAEVQKKFHQDARRSKMLSKVGERAVETATKVQNTSCTSSETSRLFEKVIKDEQPKQLYEPKAYKAANVLAPRKNILGDSLPKNSKQAHMWSTNQRISRFLQLPGEVRNLIYEYVLGGNTINIGFETYRTTYKFDKPYQVVPIFKYHCTVYDRRTNPFKRTQQPYVRVTTNFTLLNNICRQMYLESAVLPYKLNLMSFDSHNIMFNFLFMEKRLSRAQLGAITQLVLPYALPQPNMLIYLRNLEKVFLAVDHENQSKTWFRVVRHEGAEPKLVDMRYTY